MTKEQEEAIEYLKESVVIYKNTIPKISKAIETVLNMLKEKDKEIEELKQALARNIAKNFTSSMKESAKSKEDLEMLNKGWQIELEKKDKQINLIINAVYKRFKAELLLEYGFENEEQFKQYFERKSEEMKQSEIEEFEDIFGNVPFENIRKIQKYIQDNYIHKDIIKEKDEETEHYKKKNKDLSKQLLMLYKEQDNYNARIEKKNEELKRKDKIIDLIARAFKQDDVRSVEEIKKYFERKSEE